MKHTNTSEDDAEKVETSLLLYNQAYLELGELNSLPIGLTIIPFCVVYSILFNQNKISTRLLSCF